MTERAVPDHGSQSKEDPKKEIAVKLAAQPKIAIPVGLALAWLGYALLTERPTPTAQRTERELAATA